MINNHSDNENIMNLLWVNIIYENKNHRKKKIEFRLLVSISFQFFFFLNS